MVLFLVVKNKGDHKPLNVGAMLLITETKAPLGRVDGYFFGSVTNPHYIVRLADSEMQVPQGIGLSFIEEFTQHIEEEDLYKRFHYPTGYEYDLIEEEGECGPMEVLGRTSYHYEPNRGAQDNFNRIFCLQQYEPMMYQQEQIFMRPETNQQEQQYQPMMYEQEQQFMRPETNQQNQMGINLFPSQAPMMQHQQFMRHESSQQNQMGINLFPSHEAPMMQHQQFMRHESSQQNQMGIIPNLVQNQAPMMYNQQQNFIRPAEIIPNQSLMLVADLVGYLKQYLSGKMSTVVQGGPSGSFGVNLNYPNQQQFGSEMDFNPQTQPTMESQLFDAGPSSYRGGRGRY